ncbi:MAG: hypothetical protein H6Q33_1301 [Deltaproteobacteria bacterium]|nr:hypothetical protein [Deltaproteobacteria bacterium]
MTGLDLAVRYFQAHGVPLIETRFAAHRDRIAAGLVGPGSECFGFDDELSRDHDWGPGFCLWLAADDHRAIGARLQAALADLPQTFEGIGPRQASAWGGGRVGVLEIGEFYRGLIGLDRAPRSLDDWRRIPEACLATATNGAVFTDPLGEFTRMRDQLLAFYPEDVRLKKIASRCMTIAQSGQYNLPRCGQRREFVAARCAEAQFCAHVVSLVFLLNRRYAPFYKWMHRAVKALPVLGAATHHLLSELVTSYGFAKKSRIVEEIAVSLAGELRRLGLSDARSDFLVDHGPRVQERIRDPQLRRSDVWVE